MSQFSRPGTLPQYGDRSPSSPANMGVKLVILIGSILGTIAFILHFTKKSECKSTSEGLPFGESQGYPCEDCGANGQCPSGLTGENPCVPIKCKDGEIFSCDDCKCKNLTS